MNAKDKAETILKTIISQSMGWNIEEGQKESISSIKEKMYRWSIPWFKCKETALFLVEEMCAQLAIINNEESFNISKYGTFWHEVKQEIKKL